MIGDTTKEQPKFKILKSPNLKRKQKKKFVPLNERVSITSPLSKIHSKIVNFKDYILFVLCYISLSKLDKNGNFVST